MEPNRARPGRFLSLAGVLFLLLAGVTAIWVVSPPVPAGRALAQAPEETATPAPTSTPTPVSPSPSPSPEETTPANPLDQLQEFADRALPVLRVVGLFLLGYLGLVHLSLVVWTYQDIRSRSESLMVQLLTTLLVFVFSLLGYWIYRLLRPKGTLAESYARTLEREYILQDIEERPVCPTCQRSVELDFVLCPYCHTALRKKCLSCGRLMDLTWQVCPYCGQ